MTASTGALHARIAWRDEFQVVGEKIRFDPSEGTPPAENDIAKLWPRFSERVPEIGNVVGGAYGLCLFGPDCAPGRPFDYLAGVGVSRIDDVPEGMTGATFPGGLYCVVTRQGRINEIGAAFDYFRSSWLPESGYRYRGGGVEFEFYDARYRGNEDPASVMELWFPIEPAEAVPIVNRVASVFVHVSDLRRSAEWYSRLLGLPVIEERLNGGPVYWLELPGTHLILDNDAANRRNPDWNESMEPRLMLQALDIDEAYRYVSERAETIGGIERHGTMAYFNFRDSEGNALMACWTAEPSPDGDYASSGPIEARIGGAFVDVREVRSAAEWYNALLGLPLDETVAAQSVYAVPVVRGAALLLDGNRRANGETFTERFYLETKDFEAALAYVTEQGFRLAGEPNDFPDLSEFALLDPDGNRIVVACMK
ncbi:GyrI-like domain-containing protein [Paenibacillus sp.]|uniref:GyrI-like domain-containing protein n=1 Tax=Paenibacillus sp. TaxID=58172 RepID=UPI002D27222A|nr:GyrI-like domain-containing protein [Paenibacillus sp.]HZG58745.1 GyrI-like domain-containing protein [Paenibacillus sp.]